MVHFERTPVTQVMSTNSPQLRSIRTIRANGCTGMSQSLRLGIKTIKDDELTGITLHSDGYANDPSPYSEHKSMEQLCQEIAGTSAFVNTVAYSEASDFPFLSKIANDASGRCVLANSVKAVYDAIYDTSAVLSRQSVPVINYESKGSDFIVFASKTATRVNGSTGSLKVAGLSKNDSGMIYRYRKVTKEAYDRLDPVGGAGAQCTDPVYAFASAQLSAGNLNLAKYAMASTFDEELTRKHARALTSKQIAAMQQDLQSKLFSTRTANWQAKPINLSGAVTVIDLLKVLDEHRENISINFGKLQKDYKRRGLKKVNGSRDDSGKLTEPPVRTEVAEQEWVPLGSFDINRTQATVNMTVARPCKLINLADGKEITEVAGVKLDNLSDFKAYTISGDGELNVPKIEIKVSATSCTYVEETANAIRALDAKSRAAGLLGGFASEFVTENTFVLDLSSLPVTSYEFTKNVSALSNTYDEILKATTLQKILSAVAKEESAELTKEQIEALKQVCISKSLNVNIPTTNEYADLQQALNDGSVDSRTTYRVVLGNKQVLGASLPSANAFLDRWFEMVEKGSGKVADKPNMTMFLDRSFSVRGKQLSSRAKPAATDGIMKPVFEDFLATKSNGSVNRILHEAGSVDTLASILRDGAAGILRAKKEVDAYIENLYLENVTPLVFFVGCTGLLPDTIQAKSMTADEVQAKYPDCKIGKDEKEGTFFDLGGILLAVYAEKAYFSTGKPTSDSAAAVKPASKTATTKGKKKSALSSL